MTTLNVRNYGAVGDGTTDDTNAIQAAIDDAGSGDTVLLPEPEDAYLVTGSFCVTVSGNSHPDNLTITGESEASVIRYGGGNGSSNVNVVRISPEDGIEGLVIERLTIDGGQSAVNGDPNVACGLQVTSANAAAEGNIDIHIEDVVVENCYGNGLDVRSPGTRVNRCTARDNRQHGFGADTFTNPNIYDPPVEFTNCLAVRNSHINGFYGFDASGGNIDIVDCVAAENGTHGVKFTRESIRTNFVRVRCVDNDEFGFYRPPTATRTGRRQHTVYEDCISENNGSSGVRLTRDSDYVVRGEFVVTGNGSGSAVDFRARDNASLDASDATIYINDSESHSSYLQWESSGSGSIGTLATAGNQGSLSGASSISIDERTDERKTDIETVPTADEVGAWTEREPDNEDEHEEDELDENGAEPEPPAEGWTPRWGSEASDWSVVTGEEFEGGHALQFEHDSDTRTRHAISWDRAGEPADVEVLDKFRVPEFTPDENLGFHARVHLRSSENGSSHNGYWIEVENRERAFRLAKYTDGQLHRLAHFGEPEADTFYYRRFRAEGSEIKAKIWPVSESEPDDWDVEVTDDDHDSGWVGLGSFDPGAVETDVFSVGTGGESAQLTATDGGEERSPSISIVTPEDGDAIGGIVPVQIDAADPEAADDELTVGYRIDDGDWIEADYDPETGYYVGEWDTSELSPGSYTLTARVEGAAGEAETTADVVIENDVAIDTVDARDVSDTEATLVGAVDEFGGHDELEVAIEWRAVGDESWRLACEKIVDSTEEFVGSVSDLEADTEYEFRAITDGAAGETLVFTTEAGDEDENEEKAGDGPRIEQFEVTDRSGQLWTRFDVDWSVADADGNLDTVVSKLYADGTVVAAKSTSVTGTQANYTHVMRVRGDVDEVRLSVNDTENDSTTETTTV